MLEIVIRALLEEAGIMFHSGVTKLLTVINISYPDARYALTLKIIINLHSKHLCLNICFA